MKTIYKRSEFYILTTQLRAAIDTIEDKINQKLKQLKEYEEKKNRGRGSSAFSMTVLSTAT